MADLQPNTNGIVYTVDYSELHQVDNKETIKINANCKIIKGWSTTNYAFYNSRNSLKTFTFEENSQLTTIENYAFYQCSQLQSIDLSSCSLLTTIGDYAFYQCKAVSQLLFPPSESSSLTTIGGRSHFPSL